jgi:hypothetical protein
MAFISRLFELVWGIITLLFLVGLAYMAVWFLLQMIGIDIDEYLQEMIVRGTDLIKKGGTYVIEKKEEIHQWVINRRS